MTEKGYALQDKSCGIAFSLYDGKRFMKKLLSFASLSTHTLEHLPMEFFLCLDDAHHLASRKDEHKTGMILLLQQFDLHIQLILTTDSIGASLIVTSIYVMQTAHLVKYDTLTLHHLSINGENFADSPGVRQALVVINCSNSASKRFGSK